MKKSLVIIAAAAIALAGCQVSEENGHKSGKVYSATIEGQTRTSLAASGDVLKVNWNPNDKIAVTDGTNTAIYRTDDAGVTKAHFYYESGTDPYELPTAYYPAGIMNGLPSVYAYDAAVVEVPMLGSILDDEIYFKNLCGLLKVNVTTTAADAKAKTISVSADKPLSGTFTVANDAAVVENGAGVTIDCGEGVAIGSTPVTFYFSVPAGTYSDLSFTLVTADGKTQTLKAKSAITVERSKYYEADFAFNKLEAVSLGGTAILPEGPVFNTMIKQLIDPEATTTTPDNEVIKKIVFDTNSAASVGVEIQTLESEKPIYLSLDKAAGVVTISSPAETLRIVGSGEYMFSDFGALEEIVNLKCLDTEECTSMLRMFSMLECDTTYLTKVDLSSFNTKNVVTFRSMFNTSEIKELDLRHFSTESAEDESYMFSNAMTEKIDVSGWENPLCADVQYMFNNTLGAKEIKLDNFKTDNVSTMLYMFASSTVEGLDLTSFNTENVSSFGNMFYHCYNVQFIKGTETWDTSSSSLFRSMFNRCDSCTEIDCSNFDVSSSTNCQYMFFKCVGLQKLVIPFDVSNIKATNLQYFMPKSESLRELHLGENFIPADAPKIPNAFSMYYADTDLEYTGSQSPTGIAVYCSQDVAEYIVTTDFQYPCNGWVYDGVIHNPVPVKFYDCNTGQQMNIVVPPNAVEAYRL